MELGPTSALVLLWSGSELYVTDRAREYWSELDLSEGNEIYRICNSVWEGYGEVIKNRKWRILSWSKEILANSDITQVVIIAAGFAPMGIELASLFPRSTVFELDKYNMEAKGELCSTIENLHCMTADVTDQAQCRSALVARGWNPAKPTLLICEGISYYIDHSDSRSIWELFAHPESRCIFEYLVPQEHITENRRYIPEGVFNEILVYCGVTSPIARWSKELLERESGIKILKHNALSDMELERTGKTDYFPKAADGWIEIAMLDMGCA
jgi:hypothetical protein